MSPIDQQSDESPKAYQAFCLYCELPPAVRSLPKVAAQLGKNPASYQRQLERWSSKHRWVARAAEQDQAAFRSKLAARQEALERVRQVFVDRAAEAAEVVTAIAEGRLNGEGGGDRDADRVPYVKPSTRLQAAIRMLETAGITVPKRVELSGPGGSEVMIAARAAEAALSDAEFELLEEAAARLRDPDGETG